MFKSENDKTGETALADAPASVEVNSNSSVSNVFVDTEATAGVLLFFVTQRRSKVAEPLLDSAGVQVQMDLADPSRTLKVQGFAIREVSTTASGMDAGYRLLSSSGDS